MLKSKKIRILGVCLVVVVAAIASYLFLNKSDTPPKTVEKSYKDRLEMRRDAATTPEAKRSYINSLKAADKYDEALKASQDLVRETKSAQDGLSLILLCHGYITEPRKSTCITDAKAYVAGDISSLDFNSAYSAATVLEIYKHKQEAKQLYQYAYDKYPAKDQISPDVSIKSKEELKAYISTL